MPDVAARRLSGYRSTVPSPRSLALDLLLRWQDSDVFIDQLLADADRRHTLSPPDRALLHALVLGVLRHGNLLDLWIDRLRQGKLKDGPRWILRLGLFQFMHMGMPEHAAVNESVRLARHEKGLINAILRSAIREKSTLQAVAELAPADIRYSLPEFLCERWERRFGVGAFHRLAARTQEPAAAFVRLNRLKPQPTPDLGEPVPDAPDFFRVQHLPRPELAAGTVYAQDPATSVAPAMLAPTPGSRVLDACAAPGGKTAMLAQMMENRGTLLATDLQAVRLDRLSGNLSRLGVTCAAVESLDWSVPRPAGDNRMFDFILLDVPCSNTGVLQRRVDGRWRLTEDDIPRMAALQWKIVENTVPRLAPGGRLVYSTCSLEPEENEAQAERMVAAFPHLRRTITREVLPHETGWDGAFATAFEHVG